ncbi:hypothetical protein [Jeotgalibacillus terrae]|uniref:Uncharacterized protein n=1 Tax=Jeotgalibacillus terrae TaxID=587735 RepID=A0ABW5ZM30_9BACL|nr:hypothetical protein [Jeotgalibacillus terrae]MBM7581063.1 hypothetical protein [Jeotgalibacillus terrae]
MIVEKEIKIVENKAKKYKKLFEKMAVNENPVEVNSKRYYQVVFSDRKGDTTGLAILSPEQEDAEEASEAYPLLANYNGLLVNIYEESVELTKVPDYYYTQPLEKMGNNPEPELEKAKEKIERLYEFHQNDKMYFKDFTRHIANATVISQRDIDVISKAAASIDLTHLYRLHIMSRDVQVFKDWKDQMIENGLWEQLLNQVRDFYNEIINSAAEMGEIAVSWELSSADAWDVQLEEFMEKQSKNHNQTAERLRKELLRWPNP